MKNYKTIHIILISCLVIITFVSFSNSINNDFVNFDDHDYILNNIYIRSLSLNGLKRIFTDYYFGNYHPFTTITYALEFRFFKLNPAYYHIDNLILHLLNVILVYLFIFQLFQSSEHSTETKQHSFGSIFPAFIVSTLFGIHPMHVESVSWISERKDVLYTFFYISGLITYILYLRKKKKQYLYVTFCLFLFSLLSKSAAVSFPLVLILIDFYIIKEKMHIRSLVFKVQYAVFFIIAFIFGVFTLITQNKAIEIIKTNMHFSVVQKILFGFYNIIFYFIKFLYPSRLCVQHLYPIITAGKMPLIFYLSPVIVIFICILFIIYSKLLPLNFKKQILFGVLFYFFTIVFTLKAIPFGGCLSSERYTYIPYIGLSYLVSLIFIFLKEQQSSYARLIKYGVYFIFILFVVYLSEITYNRNKVWYNGITLFTDVINKNPNRAEGYSLRGSAFLYERDYINAINDLNKAITFKLGIADDFNERAIAEINLEDFNQAYNDLNMAIFLDSKFSEAYCNRGLVRIKTGDYAGAFNDFSKALKLNPDLNNKYNIYFNLGFLNEITGNAERAIENYSFALTLHPDYSEGYVRRGLNELSIKDKNNACLDFKKALEMGDESVISYLKNVCE